MIRKITGWNEPFGGGKKKAPGLLISHLTYLLTTQSETGAVAGGKCPLDRSDFGLYNICCCAKCALSK
nr:MAG TPA: hypothetical protein [Caudoviricetes sp.]